MQYSYRQAIAGTLCTTTGTIGVADGKWHYVAIAANLGVTACYYVDGALDVCRDISSCDLTATTGTAAIRIADNNFVGRIDEVRISAADLSTGGTVSPTPALGFPPAPDDYAYRYFDPSKSYAIVGGTEECLEFDEYLMLSNPAFAGGFDALLTGATGLVRNTGWLDQNNLGVNPSADLSARAKGQWYHRCFDIDSQDGQIMSNPIIAYENESFGVYDILLDNIQITQGCTIGAGDRKSVV